MQFEKPLDSSNSRHWMISHKWRALRPALITTRLQNCLPRVSCYSSNATAILMCKLHVHVVYCYLSVLMLIQHFLRAPPHPAPCLQRGSSEGRVARLPASSPQATRRSNPHARVQTQPRPHWGRPSSRGPAERGHCQGQAPCESAV